MHTYLSTHLPDRPTRKKCSCWSWCLWLTTKIYLPNHLSTCPYMHPFKTSIHSFLCSHSQLPLIYPSTQLLALHNVQIYPQINLPLYHDAFLPVNHEDQPVDSATPSHAHRCTRSLTYRLILILSFRLTANWYLPAHSTIALHIHGSTCTLICQRTYCSTYPQTHPKLNLIVHLGAISFRLTTKVSR